jgi:hypothetical protein
MYVTIKEQPCISNTKVGYYKLRNVRTCNDTSYSYTPNCKKRGNGKIQWYAE